MKIKALASLAKGEPLSPYIYNKDLGEEDVLVKVKYCTLSNSDVLFIDDFWKNTRFPVVPSEDVIGEVVRKGRKAQELKVGDIVGVGYQVYSCGQCDYCKKNQEQFCKKQKNLRIQEPGGLSDYMIVNYKYAFVLPKNLQKPEATPLFCAGLTVYSAIFNNSILKDMKVGVIGIGRLGHLAIKFLRSIGCKVIAFTNEEFKKKELLSKGVQVSSLSGSLEKYNSSFDFIFYTSTIDLDWDKFLKLLKPTGRLVIIGFPQNKISFSAGLLNDYSKRQIIGTYIGSREDMEKMIEFSSKNNILADAKLFTFEESNKILKFVREGKIKYIAVIKLNKT